MKRLQIADLLTPSIISGAAPEQTTEKADLQVL
jgi:hypothetical protein